MIITIEKNITTSKLSELLAKFQKFNVRKGLNVKKYSGKVNFGKDGLSLQKEIRSEWD